MASVLVCDDERSICETLQIALRLDGHAVETTTSGETAMRKIDSTAYEVVITDIRMPRISGLEVLRHSRQSSPESAVVLITGNEDYEAAVQAVKAGAFDYIHKGPGLLEEVKVAVSRATEVTKLRRQNFALKRDAASRNSLDNIIGVSPAIEKLRQTIRKIAPTTSTVLIHGESGTGKELVARGIHVCSPRSAEPFVCVNCGAFPEALLESEMFGYVRGAFTGANESKRGLFEFADGGTLFLDEIGEMTLTMQVKLLRVLQERKVRPVGGSTEIDVDVRVIAATNRDPEKMVADHSFREDLYYRISVIPIEVPPLRQRKDDIPILANHFLNRLMAGAGKELKKISPQAIQALVENDWPGNVRQLENTIERAVAMSSAEELVIEWPERKLGGAPSTASFTDGAYLDGFSVPPQGINMEKAVADVERKLIESALQQSSGRQTRAAELLQMSYRSFRHLVKKHRLSR